MAGKTRIGIGALIHYTAPGGNAVAAANMRTSVAGTGAARGGCMAGSGRRKRILKWIGLLGLCALAFEAYTRYPANPEIELLNFAADTRSVVLLFHGTRGRDEPYLTEIGRRFKTAAEPQTAVRKYIWSPYSDNQFRASSHALVIGAALGKELAELTNLENIRLVAHSAGAYILDPLCEAYKSSAASPAEIEMTLIDPIGIKGAWDFGYGYRNHGRCADFAAAYINTNDPTPGTNAPLQNAYNFDVTAADGHEEFPDGGHRWPLKYYLDRLTQSDLQFGVRSHTNFPRGRTD